MFSTAGATREDRQPGRQLATVAMAAITVHAPVLSIFISSIRSAGLMLMPPESKQTPLPTIATVRPSLSSAPFPPERSTIIRGGLCAPLPDREEHAHAQLGGALLVDDVDREAVRPPRWRGLVGEDLRA
jgi:hypothetical protein